MTNLTRIRHFSLQRHWKSFLSSSPASSPTKLSFLSPLHHPNLSVWIPVLLNRFSPSSFGAFHLFGISSKPASKFSSSLSIRYLNTTSSEPIGLENQNPSLSEQRNTERQLHDKTDEEVDPIDSWEEEDQAVPEIGDGGDGGGIVIQNCPWGEQALSIAHEVLLQFGDDMKLYAFRTSHRGYIYVRLDKLSNIYGCPSMEEIENYSHQYKKRLDEVGATGVIPDDLALEVSTPGAERLLKVPDDLERFKDLPMRVSYVETMETRCPEKNGVFFLELVETESGCCEWKLADVKENREPSAKGRPLSHKQKEWRLKLPYAMFKMVTLYLD